VIFLRGTNKKIVPKPPILKARGKRWLSDFFERNEPKNCTETTDFKGKRKKRKKRQDI